MQTEMTSQAQPGWVPQRLIGGLRQIVQDGGPAYGLLLLAWIIAMILVPIARWVFGEAALVPSIVVTTLLHTALGTAALAITWGWPRALMALATVGGLTWASEALGVATGFPFGAYHYTDVLQPQVLGVPLLIPAAWMMVLPSAWAISARAAGGSKLFYVLAPLALVAWDLGLDPQMVGWGLWTWPQGGAYFGIPLSNFLGWFLTAFIATSVVWWWIAPRPPRAAGAVFLPGMVPLASAQLMLVYGLTWFFMSFGLIFFWGLPGPGLALCAAMGFFLWLGIKKGAPQGAPVTRA